MSSETDFVKLAYNWYNGQNSDLYIFACNCGKIFDQGHAFGLENEIRQCISVIETRNRQDEEEDLKQFQAFLAYVLDDYIGKGFGV